MPRLKKIADEVETNEAPTIAVAEPVAPKAEVKKVRKSDPFEGMKLEDLKPMVDGEPLPNGEMEDDHHFNRDNQRVHLRKIWPGEPRAYLERNPRDKQADWYNLIGVFDKVISKTSRVLRTLKPKKNPGDKAILDNLIKRGFKVVTVMSA